MGSVVALVLLVVAAYVAVIAGGIAFEITGMDREMARFQALSAFTGTGFTTLASEQIVEHRVRRRIAMTLIVLGWAGVASVIATLMRSFQASSVMQSIETLALGASIAVLSVYLMRRYSDRLVSWIRRQLGRRLGRQLVPQENIFRVDGGLGIARIEVPPGCTHAGTPLAELDLRAAGLTVLVVEHFDEVVTAGPETVFVDGDHLVVFGRLDKVQAFFAPANER